MVSCDSSFLSLSFLINAFKTCRDHMRQDKHDLLELKSEIANAFHPIEQLFKIMSKLSEGISDDTTRSCGEVGLELCQNFRRKLEIIFTDYSKKQENLDD